MPMRQLTHPSLQEEMIRRQVIGRGITDSRVIDALRTVPRDRFFPPDKRDEAFEDNAAPIGMGQTISQPFIVALMTQALELTGQERILELGTGSGYHTAILCRLGAEVFSMERLKPLLDEAFARLGDLNCRNVHLRLGDGTLGWPQAAPFDRILIGAGAPAVPRNLLLGQLADGGIAVLPVGQADHQSLLSVRRKGSSLIETHLGACRFVPLIGSEGWPADDAASAPADAGKDADEADDKP
jgi:protein-L-isoaspartate(D-aspartate) O-methyltransferase